VNTNAKKPVKIPAPVSSLTTNNFIDGKPEDYLVNMDIDQASLDDVLFKNYEN